MARPKTETITFLTSDETARLFHALREHKRNKAIFLVAYRHGLRASEVGLLRTTDLDFKKLRIIAPPPQSVFT
jgi:integrase